MAGVGEAPARDVPRLVPVEALEVDEDPHQLGDRDDGVGVVELESDPLRQLVQVEVVREGVLDVVVQRAGDEEVLLLQPQLAALGCGVLGIEDLGDVLGEGLRPHRLGVVTGVEDLQVELVGGPGAPQPQRVDDAVPVSGDHVVVGDALDVPGGDPPGPLAALVVGVALGVPAEVHLDGTLGVRELPRVTEAEPRVGQLDLTVVDEGLAEDAVLVADAVSDARHVHRRQRVDEAGRQPAEAAVAETRLDLLGHEGVDVDAALVHRLGGDVLQLGRKERVLELTPEEVLGGEIADHLLRLGPAAHPGLEPAGHEVVTDGLGQGEVLVVDGGPFEEHALGHVELAEEQLDETVDGLAGLLDDVLGERVGRLLRRTEDVRLPGRCLDEGGGSSVGGEGCRHDSPFRFGGRPRRGPRSAIGRGGRRHGSGTPAIVRRPA